MIGDMIWLALYSYIVVSCCMLLAHLCSSVHELLASMIWLTAGILSIAAGSVSVFNSPSRFDLFVLVFVIHITSLLSIWLPPPIPCMSHDPDPKLNFSVRLSIMPSVCISYMTILHVFISTSFWITILSVRSISALQPVSCLQCITFHSCYISAIRDWAVRSLGRLPSELRPRQEKRWKVGTI